MVVSSRLNFTGSKHMALEKRKSKSKGPSDLKRNKAAAEVRFALCVKGTDFDLITGKAYQVLKDGKGGRLGYTRVIDESGEDYLYPASCFVAIQISKASRHLVQKALRTALRTLKSA
jgi:hypothetical protein